MDAMERKRAISGGFLSVMWLAVWAVAYCVAPPNKPLQFNEWGDFLSGIVAPLAFLWLILGYMQQGEELRLNTTALKSQQRELERTAVETADLAAATRRLATATQNQVEQAELEARPLLEFAHRSAGTRHIKAYLHNHGGTARNLRVGGTPMGVVVTVPPTARADPPGANPSTTESPSRGRSRDACPV